MNNYKLVLGFGAVLFLAFLGFAAIANPAFTQIETASKIADVVNGFTAPIIGILGAILIFVSLREQIKANRIQSQALNEQRELDLLYRFYEEIKTDLGRIQSEYGVKYSQPSILDSLMNYAIDDKFVHPYPDLEIYLRYVFNQFLFISKRIKRTQILNESEMVYFIEKFQYLYQLYFDDYRKRLTSKLLTLETGLKLKKSLEEVQQAIDQLDEVRNKKKDVLAKNKIKTSSRP